MPICPDLFTLALSFTDPTWSRGKRLYRTGRIQLDSWKQKGAVARVKVQSEHSRKVYQVNISVVDDPDDPVEATCSCPVRHQCKHAAAAVMHYHALCYHAGGTTPMGADEETIKRWFKALSPVQKARSSQGLLYVFDIKPSHYQAALNVTLHKCRRLKSGGWGKSSGHIYLSENLLKADYIERADSHIIAELIPHSNSFFSLQEPLAASLVQQIIETGRAFWQSEQTSPLQWGEPVSGEWLWVEEPQGLYSLKLKLETGDHCQLWPSDPPVYFNPDTHTLGEIRQSLNGRFAQQLLSIPCVDKQQLPLFISELRSHAGEQTRLLPKLDIEGGDAFRPPVPRLLLELNTDSDEATKHQARMQVSFVYQGVAISPHTKNRYVSYENDSGEGRAYRDFELEAQLLQQLADYGIQLSRPSMATVMASSIPATLPDKLQWFKFVAEEVPRLTGQGWEVEFAENFPYLQLPITGEFSATIEEDESDIQSPFFELALHLEVAGKTLPAFPLLLAAVESLPRAVLEGQMEWDRPIYVPLDDCFVSLDYRDIRPLVRQFIEIFSPNRLDANGRLKLSRYQSLDTFEVLESQQMAVEGGSLCRQMAQRLRDFDGIKQAEEPSGLKAELRPYQRQGLNWLQFLREYQLAGILADDMGLGKTLQTLTHLLAEKRAGRHTLPTLVVAPTSVLFNWRAEVDKFTPELKVLIHHGPARCKSTDTFKRVDLVITSYALLSRDEKLLTEQPFYYLVLDESHTIKNPKTKLYAALLGLKATHRLCLTGTPLQNNLGDIWSHFNFLLPGFLGSQREFNSLFRNPIEKQAMHDRQVQLTNRLAPFMLRRTKEKIARDLPPKTEIVQKIHLDGKQAQLYESVRLSMDKRLRAVIASKGIERSQIELLDALLKLRQCCCHPKLLPTELAQSVSQSAKLEALMEMLPELVSEGRSVLVFSQFTSMLALIEAELKAHSLAYLKLTGQTRNREAVVNAFQNGEAPIFLISLKAGGVGLNLTRADTVIHFDPWWNPATENQATDRAYRIGQDKPVFVYKLLVEGSIEETIFDLQTHKQALADAVLTEQKKGEVIELNQLPLEALMAPLE